MKSIPKKYTQKELRNRSKLFESSKQLQNTHYGHIFSPSYIHLSKKLAYNDFFSLYLKDFFNHKNNLETILKWEWNIYSNLFLPSNDTLKNISDAQKFFEKKKQTLIQVWSDKLERRTTSVLKKNMIANHKILDSYFFSPHKYVLSDSSFYVYILNHLKRLSEQPKITHISNISYRSIDLQTSIPDKYIIRKDEEIDCYTLKYFIWAKCEALPVCVDDIDSCCWDVALLVHPKDKRYNKHIGKNAIIPLSNRQIPIIWDENVNISIDNWIKRICPCFNKESIDLAKKYWLPTDVYVFDQKWIYTKYIWHPAFIWESRSKYYDNVQWLIKDIGNCAEEWKKTAKVPYLKYTDERLFLYKIDQTILDTFPEKQKIIDKILERNIRFSFLDKDFWDTFSKISNIQHQLEKIQSPQDSSSDEESLQNDPDKIQQLEDELVYHKQTIIDEVDKYLPDFMVCNSQLSYWRRMPFIKWADESFSFFDVENECLQKRKDYLSVCFDFVLLSLVRIWVLWTIKIWHKNEKDLKLCNYDNFFTILAQNEKKIQSFLKHLESITWPHSEYEEFIKIIENLTDENNQTKNECLKLLKKSKFISINENQIILNHEWILSNEIIDPDFVQLCMISFLQQENHKINDVIIYNPEERWDIFQEILIQEMLNWDTISHEFLEQSYHDTQPSLDNKLSKSQLEQLQRDLFSTYWENPIRLSLLTNWTHDQKEIILSSLFLKQIWNALRLCLQRDFLPQSIEECLHKQEQDFNESDLYVLYNLIQLYNKQKNIESIDEYSDFFREFKNSIQNIFLSRYLELQKYQPSTNVQFVCSYFFCLLSQVLYPLVPEFINAICHISNMNFLISIKDVNLTKDSDLSVNMLYHAFTKIKKIKTQSNIKQHQFCNIFIKCNPTLLEYFKQYEQIFTNYFHITDISYILTHEPDLLWYEVFSDDAITIWIQPDNTHHSLTKDSIESIENDIKNLDDKLDLLRQRLQILPEWDARRAAEEEYAKTKEEMENLTIKYSLLSSK